MHTTDCLDKVDQQMKFTCEFCHKQFAKEATVVSHMCEPKRRHMEQHERGVQIGLQAYTQFYRLIGTGSGSANKTFEQFAQSPYYRAFVKFGRYCVDTRVINPSQMINWLLKHNKKIDQWCSDRIYTEYLLHYLRHEAVADALTRSVEYTIGWGDANQCPPHDCLRYGNTNALCHAIMTGKLSPWAIYNSESGQAMLAKLDSQQIAMVWSYIDADEWRKIFAALPEDQQFAQHILKQAGW
jgi:hypothetical protein